MLSTSSSEVEIHNTACLKEDTTARSELASTNLLVVTSRVYSSCGVRLSPVSIQRLLEQRVKSSLDSFGSRHLQRLVQGLGEVF